MASAAGYAEPKEPLFQLGTLVATPGALDLLSQVGTDPRRLLARHLTGDWGDLDKEDWDANDQALKSGGRILSSYRLLFSPADEPVKVWVITEAADESGSRSATTVLLPEDY